LYSIYIARNEMPANETLLHQAIREDIYPDRGGYRRASRAISRKYFNTRDYFFTIYTPRVFPAPTRRAINS